MAKMSKIEWIRSLPKKVTSTAVLFFNGDGHLLIVKPNYREGWQVPGGVLEECESAIVGAKRETQEEIGLEVGDLKILGVVHGIQSSEGGERYDVVYFTFHGGVLDDEQIQKIILQKDELDEYRFAVLDEALPLLHPGMRERVRLGMEAHRAQKIMYAEYDHDQKTLTVHS